MVNKKTQTYLRHASLIAGILSGLIIGTLAGIKYQQNRTLSGRQMAVEVESIARQRKESNDTIKGLVEQYNREINGYNRLILEWNAKAPIIDAYREEHPDGTTGSTYTHVEQKCLEVYQLPLKQNLHYQSSDCPKN